MFATVALIATLVIGVAIAAFAAVEQTANTTPTTEATEAVNPTHTGDTTTFDAQWNPEDYDYALSFDVSPDAFEHLAAVKPDGVIKTFDCIIQSVDSNGITCVEPGGNYISLDASGNPGDIIQVSAFLVFV